MDVICFVRFQTALLPTTGDDQQPLSGAARNSPGERTSRRYDDGPIITYIGDIRRTIAEGVSAPVELAQISAF